MERKQNKCKADTEEEESGEVDDIDKDPDFNPDDEFIEDASMIIEDEEDMFETDKHSHAINFAEAGEYVIWIREQLVELEHAVKFGGNVVERSYWKFVKLLRDGIKNIGTWSPIEAADVNQVIKTIVDPKCTAWQKKMKGGKTGNCQTIMKAEEKEEKVLKTAEDREIPEEASTVLGEDSLKGKTNEERREKNPTIKHYFQHIQHAPEEAACASGKLLELASVLDRDEFMIVAREGTRPLIALEFPEMKQQIQQKKEEVKKAELREEMKNMNIDDIVAEQNLPTPLQRWAKSKILLPTRYLAAATHYFIYSQAVQVWLMTNKAVAKKFNVSLSSLHRITSGRRYAGESETQKLQKGEHGELTVKVSKNKEQKGKIAVTKVPMGTGEELDESTPAQGMRKRRKSQEVKPMEH